MRSLGLIVLTSLSLPAQGVFFDDFSYVSTADVQKGNWTVRTERGWPGPEGAVWGRDSLQLLEDSDHPGNRILRLVARTDGTVAQTCQAQLCQPRKFFEGTYAARVRFSNAPASGPDGDHVVQAFYAISPLVKDLDPSYSELDFEYLPNGGWDEPTSTLFNTSWETVQIKPWKALNAMSKAAQDFSGWHTLLMTVRGGKVQYLIDGCPLAIHGGKNYPDVLMSLRFNLWFIDDGFKGGRGLREWHFDLDWVYHLANEALDHREVLARVEALRKAGVALRDTVPAHQPPMDCPCNM